MKTFLVPTDFSELADRLVRVAKWMAKAEEARLVLMHVHPPIVLLEEYPAAVPIDVDVEVSKNAERMLNQQVDKLVQEGIDAEALFVEGSVVDQILAKIQEIKPDRAILGRSGHGGFFDRLFGSNAQDVALNARCPVLVVPDEAEITKLKHIIYATQLEIEETGPLVATFQLADAYDANVTLLKVTAPDQPNLSDDKEMLKNIHKTFKNYQFKTVEADSVGEGIEQFATEVQADLVVMTTQAHSFLEEIIQPSETKKYVLKAKMPILVLHF
jgi:nucleotide-binding universal stress UspA family protein